MQIFLVSQQMYSRRSRKRKVCRRFFSLPLPVTIFIYTNPSHFISFSSESAHSRTVQGMGDRVHMLLRQMRRRTNDINQCRLKDVRVRRISMMRLSHPCTHTQYTLRIAANKQLYTIKGSGVSRPQHSLRSPFCRE